MNPLAWLSPAAANATSPSPNVAIGYRPEAGSAMRRSVNAPRYPIASPIAAPTSSSKTRASSAAAGRNAKGTSLNMSTKITAGASLKPDSASSRPATRRGRGRTRRTENTAAASVEETMAPNNSAACQLTPSTRCTPTAVTTMLTITPTVASVAAGARTLRISLNRVVKPPSTRITASAAVPMFRASSTSSNRSPNPSSPTMTPTSRNSSMLGKPTRVASRVPTMLASSTKPPISMARYSCCKLIGSRPDVVSAACWFCVGVVVFAWLCVAERTTPDGVASRRRPGCDAGVVPVHRYQLVEAAGRSVCTG